MLEKFRNHNNFNDRLTSRRTDGGKKRRSCAENEDEIRNGRQLGPGETESGFFSHYIKQIEWLENRIEEFKNNTFNIK